MKRDASADFPLLKAMFPRTGVGTAWEVGLACGQGLHLACHVESLYCEPCISLAVGDC